MKYFQCLLLLLLSLPLFAQKAKVAKLDTLTPAEKMELNIAGRNSCFGQFALMDSCSWHGDSIAAGKYLLRVDPYFIIFDDQTPATIDTYLTRHYTIAATYRAMYIDSFVKVYNRPRSKVYETFKRMHDEDQAIRVMLNGASDSLTCSIASDSMQFTDSVHFAYLFRYVHAHGWPSVANGSFFASIIALHDHRHHSFYFPLIRKAVLKGAADLQVLSLFDYWMSQYPGALSVILSRYKYVRFDVTSILTYKRPDCVPEIEKVIAAHCPVNWYWEIYWDKNKDWKHATLELELGFYGRVIDAMQKDIYIYNCHITDRLDYAVRGGLWRTEYLFTKNDTSKMFMYITYGDELPNTDFDILFADSSFATHAIYFENNKAAIDTNSYAFLNDLAQWLQSKPAIKIEIQGHTDNVGKAADNNKLSQARADAVKKYLVAADVDGARLTIKGYGATIPIAPNDTDDGRSQNRRVVFRKV